MSYTLHNDEPTLDDKLARNELVKQISTIASTEVVALYETCV